MTLSKISPAIFLLSFSALSYEIALTRIFSISLWYHFAFMVISIAMLGIGASGTVLSIYPELKDPSKIPVYGLLSGAWIGLSYILANMVPFDPARLPWDRIQIIYIFIYYIIISVPFFFFGLSIASAFSLISERIGLLYGSDLLGAGAGSLVILLLMSKVSPERAVFLISAMALAGAFIIGEKKVRVASSILIAAAFFLFMAPGLTPPRMSPYKGLQVALSYPEAEHIKTYHSPFSRIDVFKSPAVRFAPGLSLKYLDALPEQTGISIDGGEMHAITHVKDNESPGFLQYLPSALAYEISRREDILILEPRGGLGALLAEYYDSKNIYKVDSNPTLIKVIRNDLRDISHGIYSKNTWHGLGRSWLQTKGMHFDIIDMPLLGTAPSGSFGISEDYRFTVEAFKEYLLHLKDTGILSITLFILPPPRVELRLVDSIIAAMEEMGIKDTEKNIVALRSWGTISIMAKRFPFLHEEIEGIKRFTKGRRFDLIYYPGIREEETNIYVKMPANEYFKAFKALIAPEARESFRRDYIFDIKSVRDDAPFFHYYLKLKNIRAIYNMMGEKWQYFIEEGYLLPAVFIQVLLLSIILVLLPAAQGVKRNAAPNNPGLGFLPYFAFLGLGFMFVEIPLIQKMMLPLENPSYAVATVLTSLLISSGAGSILSHRFSGFRNSSILVGISILIIAYSLLLPIVSSFIASYTISIKIISTFVILMPIGLLMGIPFPLGLKILGEKNQNLIPWAWAINGCFSVLAPILAVMLAMLAGFKTVLWAGAAGYLLAFITYRVSFSPSPQP